MLTVMNEQQPASGYFQFSNLQEFQGHDFELLLHLTTPSRASSTQCTAERNALSVAKLDKDGDKGKYCSTSHLLTLIESPARLQVSSPAANNNAMKR